MLVFRVIAECEEASRDLEAARAERDLIELRLVRRRTMELASELIDAEEEIGRKQQALRARVAALKELVG